MQTRQSEADITLRAEYDFMKGKIKEFADELADELYALHKSDKARSALKALPQGTRVKIVLEIGGKTFDGEFYRNRKNGLTLYSKARIEDFPFDEDFTPLSAEIKDWSVVEEQETA